VCVVDDAVEDGIGVGGIADQLVPFVDGDLAGDDRRSAAVAIFEDLKEVMARGTVKWFNSQKGYGFIQPQGAGGKDVFAHISAVEKAGLPGLDEGQIVEYEEVSNRGKSSAENLKVQRRSGRFNCSQPMEPRPTTAGLFF
jgi:cold shock protein